MTNDRYLRNFHQLSGGLKRDGLENASIKSSYEASLMSGQDLHSLRVVTGRSLVCKDGEAREEEKARITSFAMLRRMSVILFNLGHRISGWSFASTSRRDVKEAVVSGRPYPFRTSTLRCSRCGRCERHPSRICSSVQE